MPAIKLIADSGSTKTEWCLLKGSSKKIFISQGMSPYFLNIDGIENILLKEVVPFIKKSSVEELYFYGTGCGNAANVTLIKKALKNCFPKAVIYIDTDVAAAAKALCGQEKGIACILGTGSSLCYYNGKRIAKNSPGLGFVLGDEGSGAYLGKKVIQHYLYNIFDADLRAKFDAKFATTSNEILNAVYKQPLPNRYLASFAIFLAENRGHYIIENIIEDGLNDFFYMHIKRFKEAGHNRVHFTGSIAFGFKDIVLRLCTNYHYAAGNILKNPMAGLIQYHSQ